MLGSKHRSQKEDEEKGQGEGVTIWKTKFERCCFRFGGEIKQTADVVFECAVNKITDKNLAKLENAAWDANGSPIEIPF